MQTHRKILRLVLLSFFLTLVSPTHAIKRPDGCNERLGQLPPQRTKPQENFLRDYNSAVRKPRSLHGKSTEVENAEYLASIEKPGNEETRYLHVSLVPLRELNQGLLDGKEYVDAARNLFRKLLLENLHGTPFVRERLTNQLIDFKTMEFEFKGVTEGDRAQFEGLVNAAISRAQIDFEKQMRPIFGATPEDVQKFLQQRGLVSDFRAWHVAGFGKGHPDFAAAPARFHDFDAEKTADLHFHIFDQKKAQAFREESENARALLVRNRGNSKLMVDYEGTGKKVLSRVGQEIVRKAKNLPEHEAIAKVSALAKKRLGLNLSNEEALAVIQYARTSDRFNPPVRAAKPVEIHFGNAKHGVISVDFAGQGHVNSYHTMGALAAAGNETLPGVAAVQLARKFDASATARLKKLQDNFQKALLSAGITDKAEFTGDDGAVILTRPITDKQYRQVLGFLAKQGGVADNRVVRSEPIKPENELESNDHVQAELFEKKLREDLQGTISEDRLSEIAISSDVNVEDGSVELIILGSPTMKELETIRSRAQALSAGEYRIRKVAPLDLAT